MRGSNPKTIAATRISLMLSLAKWRPYQILINNRKQVHMRTLSHSRNPTARLLLRLDTHPPA